jgi:hypothetical protein
VRIHLDGESLLVIATDDAGDQTGYPLSIVLESPLRSFAPTYNHIKLTDGQRRRWQQYRDVLAQAMARADAALKADREAPTLEERYAQRRAEESIDRVNVEGRTWARIAKRRLQRAA